MRLHLLLSTAVITVSGLAGAQQAEPPRGIRAGSFLIQPSLGVGVEFDDNIFKTKNNEKSDVVTIVQPTVAVRSDWSRHSIGLGASAELGKFADNDSEDYMDYGFFADGRLDVVTGSDIGLTVAYDRGHEDRGSPDSPGLAAEPVETDTYRAELTGRYTFNRLELRPNAGVVLNRFDDPPRIGGGTINQANLDRNNYRFGMRATYELLNTVKPFIQSSYELRRYRQDITADVRDNNVLRASIGTTLDLGGIVTGDIYFGLLYSDPLNSRFDNTMAPAFGGGLVWRATQLTTVRLNSDVTFEETTINRSSGYVQTLVNVSAEHELLRDLRLGADVSYTNSDYEVTDRVDHLYGAGVSVTYDVSRYFSIDAGYDYERKNSSVNTSDYTDNVFGLRIVGRL